MVPDRIVTRTSCDIDWTFCDGATASGARVERTYSQPGTYSETLKITDDHGRTDYDFETVNVADAQHPEQTPPSIQAAYWPTTGHRSGSASDLQSPNVRHD